MTIAERKAIVDDALPSMALTYVRVMVSLNFSGHMYPLFDFNEVFEI
jgi:hypothetical protein